MAVTIRLAAPADLPQIGTITTAGMFHDEMMRWLWPTLGDYPALFRDFMQRTMKGRFFRRDYWLLVAELDDQVVGFAGWVRVGAGEEVSKRWERNRGWWSGLERTLLNLDMKYHNLLHLETGFHYSRREWLHSRTKSNSARKNCPDPVPAESTVAPPSDQNPFAQFPNHLELETLLVSPSYQRRGIGKALVEWGMEVARKESTLSWTASAEGGQTDVPVVVGSSVVGKKLYLSIGFQVAKETIGSNGEPTITHMVWWPETLSEDSTEDEIAGYGHYDSS